MSQLIAQRLRRRSPLTLLKTLGMIPFAVWLALNVSAPVKANDIIMAPAGCQAPFLDQARPMRWHEWYLMNPITNRTTWVICPLTYDEDVVSWPAGGSSSISVYGANQTGAAGAPVCFFGAADRQNISLPPYIIAPPGSGRTLAQNLSTTLSPPTWRSTGSVSHDDIRSALGGTSAQNWGLTIFCQLPPGYAISGVNVIQ
jgi:hypothetical protein